MMTIYLTEKDAVFGLHKKGYVYDFQLVGNDLLWIQEKQLILAGDFVITECYKFHNLKQGNSSMVVFAIDAIYTNIKGILIRHYIDNSFCVPPIIIKKLKEMVSFKLENN